MIPPNTSSPIPRRIGKKTGLTLESLRTPTPVARGARSAAGSLLVRLAGRGRANRLHGRAGLERKLDLELDGVPVALPGVDDFRQTPRAVSGRPGSWIARPIPRAPRPNMIGPS